MTPNRSSSMKIGDRVHLYYSAAYNQRGRVIEIIGTSIRVALEAGGTVTCPACDAEVVADGKWPKPADPSLLQGTERQWPVQIRVLTGHGRPEAQQDVTYLCRDLVEMRRALTTMEAEYA